LYWGGQLLFQRKSEVLAHEKDATALDIAVAPLKVLLSCLSQPRYRLGANSAVRPADAHETLGNRASIGMAGKCELIGFAYLACPIGLY
jgi:hypothetical protein